MDLKAVFSRVVGQAPNEAAKKFLAVKISSRQALATVWSINNGQVETVGLGRGAIKSADFAGLLAGTDEAVSAVLNDGLAESVETIFGVAPGWAANGDEKLEETKLSLLKRLCKELDLRPLGYILLPEALENYLKEKEGAPLTAILIGIDEGQGWVTVCRAGKNMGTVPLGQGETTAEKIEDSLKNFTQPEVLPARMLLYDSQRDLTELAQEINAYPWAKKLPFLHLPRVEVLEAEKIVKAVAVAGGMQMGGAFTGIEETEEPRELPEESVFEEVSAAEIGFVPERTTEKPKFSGERMRELLSKIKLPPIPKLSLPAISLGGRQGPTFLVILLTILTIGGLALYFLPQAQVIIHLTPKILDREQEVTVANQFVQTSETGTRKGVTTGKKLVGDKARGTVTIYSSAAGRTFTAGTTLVSSLGLKYLLDSDINMASGSGTAAQVTTAAAVTAADIGENYNLPAGALFTVGSLSPTSYQAKNDGALAGGNSHQATVVTKTDQDRLMATLSAELADRAKTGLNAKLESGRTLLPNAITASVTKKKFSKDVDAEADTLSLDLTMDFKGVVISQEELLNRFRQDFAADIPAGHEPQLSSVQTEIKSAKLGKNDTAVLQVRLTAKFLPRVDSPEITRNLAGKSKDAAVKLVTAKWPGVAGVEIAAKPRFWESLFKFALPWRAENIHPEIVSE